MSRLTSTPSLPLLLCRESERERGRHTHTHTHTHRHTHANMHACSCDWNLTSTSHLTLICWPPWLLCRTHTHTHTHTHTRTHIHVGATESRCWWALWPPLASPPFYYINTHTHTHTKSRRRWAVWSKLPRLNMYSVVTERERRTNTHTRTHTHTHTLMWRIKRIILEPFASDLNLLVSPSVVERKREREITLVSDVNELLWSLLSSTCLFPLLLCRKWERERER